MIISISGIENEIDFTNNINVLEIENKKLFKNLLTEINDIINYNIDSNKIILKDNDIKLQIGKNIMLILDILNIEFNSKTILTKLYSKLNDISKLDESIEDKLKTNIKNIYEYAEDIITELPFECDINTNIGFKDILKLFSVKINTDNYYNMEDKIMFLIDLISEFNLTKILMLVNIKTFFDNNDIEEIYKYAIYKNIKLLIMENNLQESILKYENKIIIDKEFDDFLLR